jgi:hypothetical protein
MPIPLRSDFDAAALRRLARRTKDSPQARRLLALAAIYDGASRVEVAQIGSVTYARGRVREVRQARITCRLNDRGIVLALR